MARPPENTFALLTLFVTVGPVAVPVLVALRVPVPSPRPPVTGPNVPAKLPLALIAVLPPTVETKVVVVVGAMVVLPDPVPPDAVLPDALPDGPLL
jgi:hypothetical protein